MSFNFLGRIVFSFVLVTTIPLLAPRCLAVPQSGEAATAPIVKKVEPPNWWIGLTPDLMVLLSGQRLQATKVACNLPDVVVGHTEATQGGDYLFVWLKFGQQLRSGTIVCHLTTLNGDDFLRIANFESRTDRAAISRAEFRRRSLSDYAGPLRKR